MSKANACAHGWTTAVELRQQVQRLWNRGELLRAIVHAMALEDETFDSSLSWVDDAAQSDLSLDDETPATPASLVFPLRLRLKKPTSRDMGEHFADVRNWIQSLSTLRYTRLELIETRHPQLGRNAVPQSLWIDSLDDAIAFIGKRNESSQFSAQLLQLMTHDTRLLHWVRRRPVKVLELAFVWERLLLVHERIGQRRGEAMYLRQLSVAGVDTKFIEAHRGTLAEWLDLTLPASAIETDHRGTHGFVRRYGFKEKPVRLRLRSLDNEQALIAQAGSRTQDAETALATADVTLDMDIITLLDPPHSQVVITENEINYLALPARQGTLAVFGSGYGLQALGDIQWLKQRQVWYWGDIDTHGFAILNELRTRLPHVRSLLMDRGTLLAHEPLWGRESTAANRKLEHLSDEEAELYQDLVECRYGDNIRLEQEQIDFEYMVLRLEGL